MKKAIAILIAVCFLVSVTATAVSADRYRDSRDHGNSIKIDAKQNQAIKQTQVGKVKTHINAQTNVKVEDSKFENNDNELDKDAWVASGGVSTYGSVVEVDIDADQDQSIDIDNDD